MVIRPFSLGFSFEHLLRIPIRDRVVTSLHAKKSSYLNPLRHWEPGVGLNTKCCNGVRGDLGVSAIVLRR